MGVDSPLALLLTSASAAFLVIVFFIGRSGVAWFVVIHGQATASAGLLPVWQEHQVRPEILHAEGAQECPACPAVHARQLFLPV